MKKSFVGSLMLLFVALIWGVAFVAQSTGGDKLGSFTFNGVRFIIAAFALFIVAVLKDFYAIKKRKGGFIKHNGKITVIAGIITGILLCVASNLQQLGINVGSSVGKAGFLTAIYIVLVPIITLIIFKKRCGINVWIGVAVALIGLYLLCVKGGFYFETADILLISCALAFSFQIIAIDYYAPKIDAIKTSCIEFFVCGVLTLIPALAHELAANPTAWAAGFSDGGAWLTLLYAGIISGGAGYTLQAVAQKSVSPTVASLMMSLESVFAALAGFLILGQTLSVKEIIGCALMFLAIIVAQVDFIALIKKRKRKPENDDKNAAEP